MSGTFTLNDVIKDAGYNMADLTPETMDALTTWFVEVRTASEQMSPEDFLCFARERLIAFRDGAAEIVATDPKQAGEAQALIDRIDSVLDDPEWGR